MLENAYPPTCFPTGSVEVTTGADGMPRSGAASLTAHAPSALNSSARTAAHAPTRSPLSHPAHARDTHANKTSPLMHLRVPHRIIGCRTQRREKAKIKIQSSILKMNSASPLLRISHTGADLTNTTLCSWKEMDYELQ